jgi:hypothetical protein
MIEEEVPMEIPELIVNTVENPYLIPKSFFANSKHIVLKKVHVNIPEGPGGTTDIELLFSLFPDSVVIPIV